MFSGENLSTDRTFFSVAQAPTMSGLALTGAVKVKFRLSLKKAPCRCYQWLQKSGIGKCWDTRGVLYAIETVEELDVTVGVRVARVDTRIKWDSLCHGLDVGSDFARRWRLQRCSMVMEEG